MKGFLERLQHGLSPKKEGSVFENREPKELAMKEFVDVVWYSFMFSQGDFKLQFGLLLNFHKLLGDQTHLNREEVFGALRERMLSRRTNDLKVTDAGIHAPVSPELIEFELSDADEGHNLLGAIVDALSTGEFHFYASFTIEGEEKEADWTSKDIPLSPDTLFAEVLINDYKFLVMQAGRQNRGEDAVANELSDPYFSFAVSYLMGDKRIQNPYFERLFTKLRPRFKEYARRASRNERFRLAEVVRVYNEHHPETPVVL